MVENLFLVVALSSRSCYAIFKLRAGRQRHSWQEVQAFSILRHPERPSALQLLLPNLTFLSITAPLIHQIARFEYSCLPSLCVLCTCNAEASFT
jgi:hypothetical protein